MNASRPSQTRNFPNRQRGIITAMAAVVLIAAVIYVLIQSFGIIGTTSSSNQSQSDSIAAFFLAESGVEAAKRVIATNGATNGAVCSDLTNSSIPTGSTLGRGRYTLSGVAAKAGAPCTGNDCDSCTVTSTGLVGAASRAVEVVFSVNPSSGGASGCGGAGTATCPASGVPASEIYPNIEQNITVEVVPVVLFSNLAFERHPQQGGNTLQVSGAACIAEPTDGTCFTQWDVQSLDGANAVTAVGGRGSAVLLNPTSPVLPITYKMTQNLTQSSRFAGIAAKFGQKSGSTLSIVGVITDTTSSTFRTDGAYWDDDRSLHGNATNGISTISSQKNTDYGQTTNGDACDTPEGTLLCPYGQYHPLVTTPPTEPSYDTKQDSRSWCHDADTLVYGFSANNASNTPGILTSFRLGTSPETRPIPTQTNPQGIVYYPRPPLVPKIYSSARYLYNPRYVSALTSISSGGQVVAKVGIPSGVFQATLTTTTATLQRDSNDGNKIYVGDKVYCDTNNGGCSNNLLVGTVKGVPDGVGGYVETTGASSSATGATNLYLLEENSTVNVSTKALRVGSNVLQVSTFNQGWLSVGDTLAIPTNTPANPAPVANGYNGVLISTASVGELGSVPASGCGTGPSMSATCNASGDYRFKPSTYYTFNARSITASGYTIHVSSGTAVPEPGTIVEVRNASRQIGASGTGYTLACVAATAADIAAIPNPAPERSSSVFYLNAYSDTGDPATSNCSTNRLTNGAANGNNMRNGTRLRLVAEQVCGGICAFFNHDTIVNGGNTNFQLAYSGTEEWVSGMTCLRGVDPDSIEGLTGATADIRSTQWRELVR